MDVCVFVFAPLFARHYIVVALSPAPAHTNAGNGGAARLVRLQLPASRRPA